MGEIVKYEAEGLEGFSVLLDSETVWLTQAQMVSLFASSKANISEHIKHVYDSEELEEGATVRKFRTVRQEGSREVARNVDYYNLDMIIAIGYRVNTKRGTKFRQWATGVLKEHLLKGFTIKQPVSVEQLSSVKEEIQGLERKVNEMLQQQDRLDTFVYDEFGRVYEIISEITEQKRLQEATPRKKIGFRFPHKENDEK